MKETLIQVNLDKDRELTLTSKNKSKAVFKFRPMGIIMQKDEHSMDSIGVIGTFTKAEMALLMIVKDDLAPCNEIRIKHEDRSIAGAVRSWLKRGLLLRTSREHYVVNPYFITPSLKYQEDALELWHRLLHKASL